MKNVHQQKIQAIIRLSQSQMSKYSSITLNYNYKQNILLDKKK